jgi:hypothetical protein
MATKMMILATVTLMLSPSLAMAAAPTKTVQSNGTHTSHGNQYPDRTPRVPNHTATLPR